MQRIAHASGEWASPIVVVWRPGETKVQLCVDYRELNKCTIADKYPLPRVDDLTDGAGQAKVTYFSTMDLKARFH